MSAEWEDLTAPECPYEDRVRRLKVPGGWLYQVGQLIEESEPVPNVAMGQSIPMSIARRAFKRGWHPPVYIPAGYEQAQQLLQEQAKGK